MKDDEKALLLAFLRENPRGSAEIRPLVHRLGIHEKRASYIFLKWTGKGWYDYGVHELGGWLEPKGFAVAAALDDKPEG